MPHSTSSSSSRRAFVRSLAGLGLSALAAPVLSPFASSARGETATPRPSDRKLGVALLGLGGYARGQLAPALQQTKLCRLAGLVSGTPSKAAEWQKKHNIPAYSVYNYENFDRIADNAEIDIVYVVTPNALHRDFVIRAAKAGKHVICEKPMATSVEDCDKMIAACHEAKRQLSIGYRLHFDPYHLEMARLGTKRVFGPVKHIEGEHSFEGGGSAWRFDKKLSGGGPLMDVGIYCLQAACYVTGEEPIAVTAKEAPRTNPGRFRGIEETLMWKMEFPSGATADFVTSYTQSGNRLHVDAADGWFELEPAFSYRGLSGRTSRGPISFPTINQQALQMDAFSRCITEKKPSTVPGEMGRSDVRILYAIYEAARTGKRVSLA